MHRRGGGGHHHHHHSGRSASRGRGRWHQPKRYENNEDRKHHGNTELMMNGSVAGDFRDLEQQLSRIDGRSYPAYKDLYGEWTFPEFTLVFDQIQGDPYASPSRIRVKVPSSICNLPPNYWEVSKARRIAMCDYLTRTFGQAIRDSKGDVRAQGGGWSGEKGGDMLIDMPGQFVLERTSVSIDASGSVEARFRLGLPAKGRNILGRWAANILIHNLPKYVSRGLKYSSLDASHLHEHVCCVEDTQHLRRSLDSMGLIAFVGNGSILPRKSGNSEEPMRDAVAFVSPKDMEVAIETPNAGIIKGMGIPKGITLIVGGGFHGKSTLLEALQTGIYDKIPGDGRELVVSDPTTVKIRAEDGRKVDNVDISPFVGTLPGGRDTRNFSSLDASGSTSQASNIQEALEVGCKTLLIDEDTSATNFMVRDSRMRELIEGHLEPITPLVQRIRSLSHSGISTVVVVGGTGEYFSLADKIVAMKSYCAENVTATAKSIAEKYNQLAQSAGMQIEYKQMPEEAVYFPIRNRVFRDSGFRHGRPKCKQQSMHAVSFDHDVLDLQAVEQLVEESQTRAICDALFLISSRMSGPWKGMHVRDVLNNLEEEMDQCGLDCLSHDAAPGALCRPRKFEIAAALNRLRSASFEQHGSSTRLSDIFGCY